MKSYLRILAAALSLSGLLLILVPAIQHFMNPVSFDRYLHDVQIGTILWFISSPFWLINKDKGA